ncbi:hypothetical protein B484DRAFT_414320, partial [Ochromonadaceae sp. CCMP2298]
MADIFNYDPHPAARPSSGGDFFAQHHLLDEGGISILADRTHTEGQVGGLGGLGGLGKEKGGRRRREEVGVGVQGTGVGVGTGGVAVQVFEDYGDNSDETYLKYHGFATLSNPFRCINLSPPTTNLRSLSEMAFSAKEVKEKSANGLLPGLGRVHESLLKLLEFRRLPQKCVDSSGALGKGLEVLLIVLSMSEEEAGRCVETFSGETGRRNWPRIFQHCGFTKTEEFLRTVRTVGIQAPEVVRQLRANGNGSGALGRALGVVQRMLALFVQGQALPSTIAQDEAVAAAMVANDASQMETQAKMMGIGTVGEG